VRRSKTHRAACSNSASQGSLSSCHYTPAASHQVAMPGLTWTDPPGWRGRPGPQRAAQFSLDFGPRASARFKAPWARRGCSGPWRWRIQLLLKRFWIRKELALEQAPAGAGSGAGERHRTLSTPSRWCRSIKAQNRGCFHVWGNPSRAFDGFPSPPAGVFSPPSLSTWDAGGFTDRLFTRPGCQEVHFVVSCAGFRSRRDWPDERLGTLISFMLLRSVKAEADPSRLGRHQPGDPSPPAPASARETPPCRRRRAQHFSVKSWWPGRFTCLTRWPPLSLSDQRACDCWLRSVSLMPITTVSRFSTPAARRAFLFLAVEAPGLRCRRPNLAEFIDGALLLSTTATAPTANQFLTDGPAKNGRLRITQSCSVA